ncbi:unnamed protein product [Toxocara canis]|uniref:ZP domain-containing protein n=1 Tax=Toxocara canis TaxID=6265 RepID=A0A183U5E6_TOXCA|nr:unnamed protein product [Toxocara canis]
MSRHGVHFAIQAAKQLKPNDPPRVLKGGANGEAVKYAVIGEVVYHKWTCSGAHDNAYCMTVHSCTVDDGQGSRQQIIDPAGCATDRYLLKNLEYLDQLSAGQEVYVFKFADRSSVFFTCQIRLELRDEASGSCDVSRVSLAHFDVRVPFVPRVKHESKRSALPETD